MHKWFVTSQFDEKYVDGFEVLRRARRNQARQDVRHQPDQVRVERQSAGRSSGTARS